MKKTFSLEIKSPCDENIKDMKTNANGFFCDSCVKNVIDLSTKTNSEVAQFIAKNKNNTSICARLKTSQLEEQFEYNELSKVQNFKYAAAIAATVLLASPVLSQEKNPPKTEINCPKPNPDIMGKMIARPIQNKVVFFTLEGIILDDNTKKPLSDKQFPKLNIFVGGAKSSVELNAKNGKFSVPIAINEKSNQVYITINSNDLSYSKTITIDLKKIKNNILKQTIYINAKEFRQMHIAGGLGVNYIDNKKNKNS